MISALIVAAVTLSPFVAVYLLFNGLFALDDRHWARAWGHYVAYPPPRPSTLGNVAPNSADGTDAATSLAGDVATEVAEDD